MLQALVAIALPLATLVSGVISLFALINWIKARAAAPGSKSPSPRRVVGPYHRDHYLTALAAVIAA